MHRPLISTPIFCPLLILVPLLLISFHTKQSRCGVQWLEPPLYYHLTVGATGRVDELGWKESAGFFTWLSRANESENPTARAPGFTMGIRGNRQFKHGREADWGVFHIESTLQDVKAADYRWRGAWRWNKVWWRSTRTLRRRRHMWRSVWLDEAGITSLWSENRVRTREAGGTQLSARCTLFIKLLPAPHQAAPKVWNVPPIPFLHGPSHIRPTAGQGLAQEETVWANPVSCYHAADIWLLHWVMFRGVVRHFGKCTYFYFEINMKIHFSAINKKQ